MVRQIIVITILLSCFFSAQAQDYCLPWGMMNFLGKVCRYGWYTSTGNYQNFCPKNRECEITTWFCSENAGNDPNAKSCTYSDIKFQCCMSQNRGFPENPNSTLDKTLKTVNKLATTYKELIQQEIETFESKQPEFVQKSLNFIEGFALGFKINEIIDKIEAPFTQADKLEGSLKEFKEAWKTTDLTSSDSIMKSLEATAKFVGSFYEAVDAITLGKLSPEVKQGAILYLSNVSPQAAVIVQSGVILYKVSNNWQEITGLAVNAVDAVTKKDYKRFGEATGSILSIALDLKNAGDERIGKTMFVKLLKEESKRFLEQNSS